MPKKKREVIKIMNNAQAIKESIDLAKTAIGNQLGIDQANQGFNDQQNKILSKNYTTGTGLVGYNLSAPAKQLVSFLFPLCTKIPRVQSQTGTVAHWNVITGVSNSGKASTLEGSRGSAVNTTLVPKYAAFKTIGLQDSVTLEAIAAGRNYQDPKTTAHTNLLLRLKTEEEKMFLFANGSTALNSGSAATAPTVTVDSAAGHIGAGTYYVKVAALTGVAANRVVIQQEQLFPARGMELELHPVPLLPEPLPEALTQLPQLLRQLPAHLLMLGLSEPLPEVNLYKLLQLIPALL
jgi:hypothetical protein